MTVTPSYPAPSGCFSLSERLTGTVAARLAGGLLLLLLGVAPCMAADSDGFLMGRVVEVDREHLRFEVEPTKTREEQPARTVVVTADESRADFFLPECVEPGETVRIWGHYADEGQGVFQATVVKGTRHLGGMLDRSGVRSRLRGGMGGSGGSRGGMTGGGGRGGRQNRLGGH